MMFPSASKLFSGMNSMAGKMATKTAGVNSYNTTPTTLTVTTSTIVSATATATTTTSISKNSLNTVVEETGTTI